MAPVSAKAAPAHTTSEHTVTFDLEKQTIRELNAFLHGRAGAEGVQRVEVINPFGSHNIAAGIDLPIEVTIQGHAGYYAAGMNKQARVTIHGNAGKGLAENIMSGVVRVTGNASDCAAASGRGGLVVIEGDAASRCGISMKGVDIVVGGDIGHMSAFMAQAGTLVCCGNAGAHVGDSLYETVIYVGGKISSLGADARQEAMTEQDYAKLRDLLERAGMSRDVKSFKRVASARTLYHWNAEAGQEY